MNVSLKMLEAYAKYTTELTLCAAQEKSRVPMLGAMLAGEAAALSAMLRLSRTDSKEALQYALNLHEGVVSEYEKTSGVKEAVSASETKPNWQT